MQLANVIVRLGGLLTNTVPKIGVTPAEVLVLRHIHGNDSVVDIRVTGEDPQRRMDEEYGRLSATYDRAAGGFVDAPGNDEMKSIMARLFPGAMKKLPVTFAEIGIDSEAPPSPDVASTPKRRRRQSPPPTPVAQPEAVQPETDADEAEGEEAEGEEPEADAERPAIDPAFLSEGENGGLAATEAE